MNTNEPHPSLEILVITDLRKTADCCNHVKGLLRNNINEKCKFHIYKIYFRGVLLYGMWIRSRTGSTQPRADNWVAT
jgi:hypothetical protein